MSGSTSNGTRARSITAAAKRLDVRVDQSSAPAKRTDQGWQAEAWAYFDEVPEVKFAARFLGAALSRLRLYPSVVVRPDDAPMALADAAADPDSPVTAEFAAAADEEWERLNGGEGLPALQREFGVCLTISGECNLVGREVDGVEEWRVYSESAVVKAGNRLAIKDTPNGTPTELGDDDFIARVWRRHSRWPGLADSNMRAILDVCEELLIYGRQFRAVGRSRNNAGILLLPNELDFTAPRILVDEDPDGSGPLTGDSDADDLTDLERGIVESMVTPTADDGSASQVVPHLLRGPAEVLEKVRHIALDRKIDEQAIARMVHLISRAAHGLDVPVEILTGVADANHWTAWQIEDSTYKAHVEPLAQVPAQALALVFLRPALIERGFSPELVRLVGVSIDPSALVVRPNRAVDAKDAFDRNALSWEALRQHLGFSEAEAPSPEELLLRYTLDRSIGGLTLTRDLLNTVGYEEVPANAESDDTGAPSLPSGSPSPPAGSPPSGSGEEGGETTPDTQETATQRTVRALAAAASASSNLGERLAAIDARLRDRVQIAASEALSAALARAGARLRARAQGDPELRERVNGQPNERVGELLGAEAAAALASADELLSEADFDQLRGRFMAWVGQARREALDVARRDVAAHGVEGDEFAEAAQTEMVGTDDDDEAGWLLLLGSLLTLGRSRIFTPAGTPDDGEFDPNVAVPAGPVREALARAGGALGELGAPSSTGLGAASGGPASGARMLRLVRRFGAVAQAWRWEVGMPARPFPPHQALAGVIFRTWDDAALTNGGRFPHGSYYYPGDHRGCQCDAVPVLVYEGTTTLAPSR